MELSKKQNFPKFQPGTPGLRLQRVDCRWVGKQTRDDFSKNERKPRKGRKEDACDWPSSSS